MTSVTFRHMEPRSVVALVAETDLQGIEWGGDVHVPPGNVELARDVGVLTRDAGLATPSYGSYFRLGEDDEADFLTILKSAEALGVRNVRVWTGRKGSALADAVHW